ncbi:MAG: HEPN domain-containing protein [bacterium]|jgi:HEPN domain-containing protein|nr:HEPN domain-containing protein [candidate division KSB1 bacterium]MDH7561655.1 HEPN domain-containing protein [bacterium]
MRRAPLEQGLRWLEQATEDLKWARHLAEQGAYHLACFLAQQVAEKAIKAFLYAQGEEIVLGHSVQRLCAQAADYRPEFSQNAMEWSILDGYYVPTRYPNGLPDGIPAKVYTKTAAHNAVDMAGEAVDMVRDLLKV